MKFESWQLKCLQNFKGSNKCKVWYCCFRTLLNDTSYQTFKRPAGGIMLHMPCHCILLSCHLSLDQHRNTPLNGCLHWMDSVVLPTRDVMERNPRNIDIVIVRQLNNWPCYNKIALVALEIEKYWFQAFAYLTSFDCWFWCLWSFLDTFVQSLYHFKGEPISAEGIPDAWGPFLITSINFDPSMIWDAMIAPSHWDKIKNLYHHQQFHIVENNDRW